MDFTAWIYILPPLTGSVLAAVIAHLLQTHGEKAELHVDAQDFLTSFLLLTEGKRDAVPIKIQNIGKRAIRDVSVSLKIPDLIKTIPLNMGTINPGKSVAAWLPVKYALKGSTLEAARKVLGEKLEKGESIPFEICAMSEGKTVYIRKQNVSFDPRSTKSSMHNENPWMTNMVFILMKIGKIKRIKLEGMSDI